jgi:XTP/dITP diphosphohydrolase
LALIDQKKNEFVFRGTLKGKIVFPPKGKNGFGYDPIFVPLNFNKTLAQLSPSLKNSLSHRKKALDKLFSHSLFKNLTFNNIL